MLPLSVQALTLSTFPYEKQFFSDTTCYLEIPSSLYGSDGMIGYSPEELRFRYIRTANRALALLFLKIHHTA